VNPGRPDGASGPAPAAIDRRSFLGALPGVVLLAAGSDGSRRSADGLRPRPLDALGIQLYTLRTPLADDLIGTLAAVAAIGYREVELAGLHGLTPRQMRTRLDDAGLRAASSHHGLEEVRGTWSETLEGARELGQGMVVVPSIPSSERGPEELRQVAADLNRAGEAARAAGLRFGYHNHDWELAPLGDGTRPMDLLLERTEPDLVDWQMDVFWTVNGGADPARYLRTEGGRVTSLHVKDRTADGRMVDVGDGIIDFASLVPLAEGLGLRHAFVEHDDPDDPLASARRSFAHLRAILG
jgi:sugar phosphate isomerase/epimerase